MARSYIYICMYTFARRPNLYRRRPLGIAGQLYALCTTTSEAVRVRLVGFECVCERLRVRMREESGNPNRHFIAIHIIIIYDVIHTLRKYGFVIRARLEQCTYYIIILCIISVHVGMLQVSSYARGSYRSPIWSRARENESRDSSTYSYDTHDICVYKYMRKFNNVYRIYDSGGATLKNLKLSDFLQKNKYEMTKNYVHSPHPKSSNEPVPISPSTSLVNYIVSVTIL